MLVFMVWFNEQKFGNILLHPVSLLKMLLLLGFDFTTQWEGGRSSLLFPVASGPGML